MFIGLGFFLSDERFRNCIVVCLHNITEYTGVGKSRFTVVPME